MNLVPWFPEIAVLAGAVALIPALLALRTASSRPVPETYIEPLALSVVAVALLDGLLSARTGASFAVGTAAALAIQWVGDFGVDSRRVGLFASGAVLLALGLVFELFGSSAGMDDGGWHLFGQLIAAFALGSSLITTLRPASVVPDAQDAATFGVAGALVIASATPLVANRVDGVALPVLVLVAGLIPLLVAFTGRLSGGVGTAVSALIVAGVTVAIATGLDPVSLTRDENPVASWGPAAALLVGIALGVLAVVIKDKRWALAVLALSLVPFHLLGPYGTALGGLAALAGTGLLHRPSVATTFLTVIALLAASHSGSPLATPSHVRGWITAVIGLLVLGGIGVLGKGPRLALLRMSILLWIVVGPRLY